MTPSAPLPSDRCPCSSGDVFGSCCGPVIDTGVAPGAVRLMRSRFTAFAIGDGAHLLRTWHPSTRPATLEQDPDVRWLRLDIVSHERGGPVDDAGTVEFEARYRDRSGAGVMRERSRFVREGGFWSYLDGAAILPSR